MPQNQADHVSQNRDKQEDIWVTATYPGYHSSMILSHWDKLTSIIDTTGTAIDLNGKSLDLATVVAVARYVSDFEKNATGYSICLLRIWKLICRKQVWGLSQSRAQCFS